MTKPKSELKHANESFESLFRRFKKNVERDDVMGMVRDRECYEKPSIKRKRANAAATKREQRRREETMLPEKKVMR